MEAAVAVAALMIQILASPESKDFFQFVFSNLYILLNIYSGCPRALRDYLSKEEEGKVINVNTNVCPAL